MSRTRRLIAPAVIFALVSTALTATNPVAASPTTPSTVTSAQYEVSGVRTLDQRNAVAATGVAVDGIEHGVADVTATPAEVLALQKLGFTVVKVPDAARPDASVAPFDFPSADSQYHNYAEMVADINAVVAAHPSIVAKASIGTSYQGRDMPIVKISDNVSTDENEPEVLYNAHQNARERLTVEMALYLI